MRVRRRLAICLAAAIGVTACSAGLGTSRDRIAPGIRDEISESAIELAVQEDGTLKRVSKSYLESELSRLGWQKRAQEGALHVFRSKERLILLTFERDRPDSLLESFSLSRSTPFRWGAMNVARAWIPPQCENAQKLLLALEDPSVLTVRTYCPSFTSENVHTVSLSVWQENGAWRTVLNVDRGAVSYTY